MFLVELWGNQGIRVYIYIEVKDLVSALVTCNAKKENNLAKWAWQARPKTKTRKEIVWASGGDSAQVKKKERNSCGLVIGPNMTGCR